MDLLWGESIEVDWESTIVSKLRKLERGALLGEYIDGLDAASLSSCFLPDEEEAVGTKGLRLPELRGLERLILHLTALLNEAHIAQQSVVAALKADCLKASRVSASSAQEQTKLRPGTSWSSLPAADDDEVVPMSARITRFLSPPQHQLQHQLSDAPRRQLQRHMQGVHDRAVELLNAKLHAYEIVAHTQAVYAAAITTLATAKGVSRAPARAAYLLDLSLAPVRSHRFLESAETQDIVNYIRELWSTNYLDSRRNLAERRLQLTHDAITRGKEQSGVRFKAGAGLALLAWAISECFNNEQGGRQIWHDPTFAIFVCFGDLLLLLWMWGVSMHVWRGAGIDFVRLLSLQNTEVANLRAPEHHIYAAAIDLTLVFLVVFIAFNKAVRGVLFIHGSLAFAHSLPTLMVIFFVYNMIHPLHARAKWHGFLGQVLAAPFFPVKFRDGYIGDLLTSLVRVLIPLCFSFAYLIMSALAWTTNNMRAAASTSDLWWQESTFFRLLLVPFLTLFPLWIRLMQCLRRSVETGKRWPHMANALKYTSAIVVISLGTFQPLLRDNPLWVAGFICATLYQFVWDLTMDWGIVVAAGSAGASSSSWGGMSLRRVRLLGPLSLYVAVIVSNLVLRFAWALTLLPVDPGNSTSLYALLLAYLGPVIAAAEILRRMVWGFFRLELEQIEVLGAAKSGAVSGGAVHSDPDAKDLDEMPLSPAANLWDPDGRYSILPSWSQSIVEGSTDSSVAELDWLPLPGALVDFIAARSWLDGRDRAPSAAKARLAESILFAAAVLGLILHAASLH